MYRPRVARTQSTEATASPTVDAVSADSAHRWRVRAGALSLLAVAVIIPVAAGAAAEPTVKGRATAAPTKISVQTSALAKRIRIPKPKVIRHAKAKPATPVTVAPKVTAPPPTTAPPTTAPPTTQYIPPTTQYIPPTTVYIPPTTQYIPPTTQYIPPTTQYIPPTTAAPMVQGTGRCGGNLPPCYVMMRESKGIITARNPTSTASGKWQFLDSTWAGFGGYHSAADAPESVQDAKAAALWAGGAGCSHWSAC